MKYKDYFGNDYEILGWDGCRLEIKDDAGNIWSIGPTEAMELLNKLKIHREEIPDVDFPMGNVV